MARHAAFTEALHLSDCLFNRFAEDLTGRGVLLAARQRRGFLCGLQRTGSLERGGFHNLAAQLLGELHHVNLVSVFLHEVDHIQRHNGWDTQLEDLRG